MVLAAAADSVPTSYEEDGKQVGILVDVINEAFRRAGYAVEIRLMPWARCLGEVKDGLVDGIFSVFVTSDRQQFLNYTNEVLITQVQALFVLNDSSVKFDGDLKALSDYSIGIIIQTSYGPRLDAALKGDIFQRIDTARNSEINMRKLLARRVDVIPSYQHVALGTAKKLGALGKIRQLYPEVEAIPSYLAFSRQRDYGKIIRAFDVALASMKKDGTYAKLFSRYLQ